MQPRKQALLAAAVLLAWSASSLAQRRRERAQDPSHSALTQILGRPTARSIALSVLSPETRALQLEYGTRAGVYTNKTRPVRVEANQPVEILVDRLQPDTAYFYRLNGGPEYTFHTQRAPGSTFTFGVQGDSHPERLNRMYHPDLYTRTMNHVAADRPDFYITLGDDFNVDQLHNRGMLNAGTVSHLYVHQRAFLGIAGRTAPLFLVNGNHEQAAKHMLDGTPNSVAVLSGRARNLYYPLPAPDGFYTGDSEPVEFVGLPRDYYAWEWGDALFVTLDPYWHSPVPIDAGIGGGGGQRGGRERKGVRNEGRNRKRDNGDRGRGRRRDGWAATMGDAQYRWLKKTLETSKAKYKFVFAHHVLGTGRGAVEVADLYEWGGRNRNGEWEFDKMRPGWELPVHQLFVKHKVTIFFQGHDHLFARQEKDGVIYQETPNPADSTYTAFNREAYRTGDILPNSGYLRVTVSADEAKVDYVRSYLEKDETPEHPNGEVAFSYTVRPR
ncbi:MAG: metallophosphoesterase [Bryobacteraceae bacterium]